MSNQDEAFPRVGAPRTNGEAPGTTLTLGAGSARELMTSNPVTIRADATLLQAVDAFGMGFAALPVVGPDGKPVGVLSRSDLLQYMLRELGTTTDGGSMGPGTMSPITRESLARKLVSEVMSPEVFTVSPKTPAITVVTKMLVRKVHRLFVVDDAGMLMGVITTIDVIFKLQP